MHALICKTMNFEQYLQYQYDHLNDQMIRKGNWRTWAIMVKAGKPVAHVEKKLEREYMQRMFKRSSRGIKRNSGYFNVPRGLVRKYWN